MIFQNPYEALDPRYTILEAVMEPLAIHGIGNARDRRLAAKQMLEKVDLRPTEHFANRYPLIYRRPAPARGDRPCAGARASTSRS